MNSRLLTVFAIAVTLLVFATPLFAQDSATIARVVYWQPKPNMDRDFEQGYRRHLEWHRRNRDTWTWLGWSIAQGQRDGLFMDATLFHHWSDLDHPVDAAGDGADNAINTERYANVVSNTTYESIAALSTVTAEQLTWPQMTIAYFEIAPGGGSQFESALQGALPSGGPPHLVLRPLLGSNDYLLLLTGEKASDFAAHAQLLAQTMQRLRQGSAANLLVRFRTETARHRPDMSYHPEP